MKTLTREQLLKENQELRKQIGAFAVALSACGDLIEQSVDMIDRMSAQNGHNPDGCMVCETLKKKRGIVANIRKATKVRH